MGFRNNPKFVRIPITSSTIKEPQTKITEGVRHDGTVLVCIFIGIFFLI